MTRKGKGRRRKAEGGRLGGWRPQSQGCRRCWRFLVGTYNPLKTAEKQIAHNRRQNSFAAVRDNQPPASCFRGSWGSGAGHSTLGRVEWEQAAASAPWPRAHQCAPLERVTSTDCPQMWSQQRVAAVPVRSLSVLPPPAPAQPIPQGQHYAGAPRGSHAPLLLLIWINDAFSICNSLFCPDRCPHGSAM